MSVQFPAPETGGEPGRKRRTLAQEAMHPADAPDASKTAGILPRALRRLLLIAAPRTVAPRTAAGGALPAHGTSRSGAADGGGIDAGLPIGGPGGVSGAASPPPISRRRSIHDVVAALPIRAETVALLKKLVPVLSCGLALLILGRLVPLSTFGAAFETAEHIAPGYWAVACIATVISFWAIGRAEAVVHDLAGTGVGFAAARRAGWRAVALAQGLGFGPLTAGLARARSLPRLLPWDLARVTAVATVGFIVALAFLIGAVTVGMATQGVGALAAFLAVGLVLLRRIAPLPGLPGLRPETALRLLFWTACDTAAAASVLWLFLPGAVPFAPLFAAYLLALGAGLLSQSPGGLGAFELALLALLPAVPPSDVLAAALAYRVVYQVAPALAAGALLLRAPRADATHDAAHALVPAAAPARRRALFRSGQADWGLVYQGARIQLTADQESGWLTRTTPLSLVTIAAPLGAPAFAPLCLSAQDAGLWPLLYKCDARTAARARALGWRVAAIAQEAIVTPARWSVDGPSRRQLRRKLKSATQGGVVITAESGPLPLAEMALVSALWAARQGGERGFSMGRMDASLVQRQVVMVARVKGKIVGFVTFHRARAEWALDLIRYTSDAPSGTTQALIVAAIARARQANVARLSLAACPLPHRFLPRALRGTNLHQFKKSFGPRWIRRYAAAPGAVALAAGLASVACAVRWPGRLTEPDRQDHPMLLRPREDRAT